MQRSKAPSQVAKRQKTAAKSKTNTKYRVKPNTSLSMVTLGNGFPAKVKSLHRYNETILLTATSGVLTTYAFSCNGMYDPNISGTGHQPLYFDQLSAIYNHYTVIGSKCTIKVSPRDASNVVFQVGMYVNDGATGLPADISAWSEQTGGTVKIMPPNSNNVLTLTNNWSAKQKFGGSVLADSELQGSTGTNPLDQSYYRIAVQGSTATTFVALVEATIEYIAVWSEIKDIPQS